MNIAFAYAKKIIKLSTLIVRWFLFNEQDSTNIYFSRQSIFF